MFFGYFLNIKKVTPSADFVISPAKAGAFLFFHTGLPLSPRPLLPFGRISPAAKPGWPVTGPTFWVCRAKSRAAFRCAKPPCAVVRFAAMASPPRTAVFPFPSRLRRAGSPTAKPRPLLPFGRISPAAKPGWPVVAPAGGNVLAPPFSLRSNVAPRSHPGPCSRSVAFRLRRNRAGRSSAPPFGFAAQNQARHFAARNHPGRLSASRPWLRHPAPLFCRSRHACAAPGPQRQNPGACSHSVAFHSAKPRGRLPAPPFGFAAQNRARHFAARNHPGRPPASRPWLRRPAPSFSPPRRSRAHNGIRLLFSDKYEQKA